MPTTVASGQAPEVDTPKHPLYALTTYELRDYRRQLERAIGYFDTKNPVPPVRGELQARLDEVLAEYEDRKRIAGA